MRKTLIPVGAMAVAALSLSIPSFADAHYIGKKHRHYRHHYSNSCADKRHRRGANGAIIGAVGGGIVANSMARGNRTGGTLLGAGVGALAGHEIGKNSTRC